MCNDIAYLGSGFSPRRRLYAALSRRIFFTCWMYFFTSSIALRSRSSFSLIPFSFSMPCLSWLASPQQTSSIELPADGKDDPCEKIPDQKIFHQDLLSHPKSSVSRTPHCAILQKSASHDAVQLLYRVLHVPSQYGLDVEICWLLREYVSFLQIHLHIHRLHAALPSFSPSEKRLHLIHWRWKPKKYSAHLLPGLLQVSFS